MIQQQASKQEENKATLAEKDNVTIILIYIK